MTLVVSTCKSSALLIACCLLLCRSSAQTNAQQGVVPIQLSQDQSFYSGIPVTHPEWLSGIWEAPDGHGGMIGLHLALDAAAPTDATTLTGTHQSSLDLTAAIYHRAGGAFATLEMNGFTDSQRGGGLRYAKGRLTLHDAEFDLDLVHIAGNRWSGRVHRKDFDSDVVLSRPGYGSKAKKAWLVGSWLTLNEPGVTCLYIWQSDNGGFVGWSDSLVTLGRVQFAPQVQKPLYALQHYGELAKVQASANNLVDVELYAYTAGCCSHSFAARSAADSTVMKAIWPEGGNQAPHRSEWKKMPGDTCIAPALP